MFRHLLLPLDGSRLAEAAIPVARTLAGELGATISLLHVLEKDPPERVHGEPHLRAIPDAERYLSHLAAELRERGLNVDLHAHDVAEGDVARSITQHAQEMGCDLILLCTHGSGGLKSFVAGSIAQQVIGAGEVPVLIIHPEEAPSLFCCRRIAVPLDSAAGHESSIPVAAGLAQATGATLELVTVIPRRGELGGAGGALGRMLPVTTAMLLDEEAREATSRLSQLVSRLEAAGVPARSRVQRGDPIPTLVADLQQTEVDLVVLSTHTKRGWAAFWSGSVAPRLIAQWRRPVLLVREETHPSVESSLGN